MLCFTCLSDRLLFIFYRQYSAAATVGTKMKQLKLLFDAK